LGKGSYADLLSFSTLLAPKSSFLGSFNQKTSFFGYVGKSINQNYQSFRSTRLSLLALRAQRKLNC